MPKIKIDSTRCVHCGSCTGACKNNALFIDKETAKTFYMDDKCTACGSCAEACPRRAIAE